MCGHMRDLISPKINQREKIDKLVIKMKNQLQENSQLLLEVESKLDFLVKEQERYYNKLESIENDIRKGFIGLALRNEELLNSNAK